MRRGIIVVMLLAGLVMVLGIETAAVAQVSETDSSGGNDWVRKREEISLELEPQKGRAWCWAALTVMIGRHLGIADMPTQCQLVERQQGECFDRDICCPEACNSQHSCNTVASMPKFHQHGIDFDMTLNHPLTWDEIVELIDENKPIMYIFKDEPGSGHGYIIFGYKTKGASDDKRNLVIYDPDPACQGNTIDLWFDNHYYGHHDVKIHLFNFRRADDAKSETEPPAWEHLLNLDFTVGSSGRDLRDAAGCRHVARD